MIIQIIGKPCSGKSSFIKKYVQETSDSINYIWLDVAAQNTSYDKWFLAENLILNHEFSSDENYLIESISGFSYLKTLKNSFTIMFECNEYERITRAINSRHELWNNNDLYYHDILISQSIRPDHIINTSSNSSYMYKKEAFESIIKKYQSLYS